MPLASPLRALLPALLVVAALSPVASAQRALTDIPVPDPAAELAAMEVAEDPGCWRACISSRRWRWPRATR